MIKMPLGTEVGLGPGGIVLDGGPAASTERGTAAPTFRPTLLWHGRPSQQLLISSLVAQLTAQCFRAHTQARPSAKNCSLAWADLDRPPCNTWFLSTARTDIVMV